MCCRYNILAQTLMPISTMSKTMQKFRSFSHLYYCTHYFLPQKFSLIVRTISHPAKNHNNCFPVIMQGNVPIVCLAILVRLGKTSISFAISKRPRNHLPKCPSLSILSGQYRLKNHQKGSNLVLNHFLELKMFCFIRCIYGDNVISPIMVLQTTKTSLLL